MTTKRGLTIGEVVKDGRLGRRSTIYKLINDGALRARKLGTRTIILADDIEAAVKKLPIVEPKPVPNKGE